MHLRILIGISICLISSSIYGQSFTRQDTLRGALSAERTWWDLTYYHLDLKVNPSDSTITGQNTIQYRITDTPRRMQIDLQPPMQIIGVTQGGMELTWTSDDKAHFIHVDTTQSIGSMGEVIVKYGGRPRVSTNPPWTGGFTWSHDSQGQPFVATSCQGDGSSLWWPCKDHPKDEVDSMLISVTYPSDLMNVSNGRLRELVEHGDGWNTTHWFVSNPINDYGVNVNIADYAHFSEVYNGEGGALDCDYWVLKENLDKAKEHFRQVPMMLEAFEHWFGKYPWYEDSFKLVEAPYLGMEHQSSVTYGNGYMNGYRGFDLSRTGEGLKFDFIIIHESGHEWFANNITYQDVADMWIHEGFTAYSENLYLDYHYGQQSSEDYVIGTRKSIQNDRPVIGTYGVSHQGSGDMYYKGANLLHTIRTIINDDNKWRNILRGLNAKFYHQTVTTAQVENYIIDHSGIDFSNVFDQYLRDARFPVLEYRLDKKKINYRWTECLDGFDMPMELNIDDRSMKIKPTTTWQSCKVKKGARMVVANRNYYIELKKVE